MNRALRGAKVAGPRRLKDKPKKRGVTTEAKHHKRAILTLVERGGAARSFHIPTARASSVMPIIYDNIADEKTRIMTDDASYYSDHIRRSF